MFRGVQKFAAYDKHGKLVAGDLEKEVSTTLCYTSWSQCNYMFAFKGNLKFKFLHKGLVNCPRTVNQNQMWSNVTRKSKKIHIIHCKEHIREA
jgi:hypothetical protein